MSNWVSKNRHKYLLQYHIILVCKYRKKIFLCKNIADVSWRELTRQLAYKANWYGRTYIQVDTYYASSQTCHVCGYKNIEVKDLSVRNWSCPNCNIEHDRDENAAINILYKGLGLA